MQLAGGAEWAAEAYQRAVMFQSLSTSRVRDTHVALNGETFSWSDPPVTSETGERNHPGEDYSCRCVAVAVLDLS